MLSWLGNRSCERTWLGFDYWHVHRSLFFLFDSFCPVTATSCRCCKSLVPRPAPWMAARAVFANKVNAESAELFLTSVFVSGDEKDGEGSKASEPVLISAL